MTICRPPQSRVTSGPGKYGANKPRAARGRVASVASVGLWPVQCRGYCHSPPLPLVTPPRPAPPRQLQHLPVCLAAVTRGWAAGEYTGAAAAWSWSWSFSRDQKLACLRSPLQLLGAGLQWMVCWCVRILIPAWAGPSGQLAAGAVTRVSFSMLTAIL